jgi:hypothetical protein
VAKWQIHSGQELIRFTDCAEYYTHPTSIAPSYI